MSNKKDKYNLNSSNILEYKELCTQSVIDAHVWDRVGWRGVTFLQFNSQAPCLALLFENETLAREIFMCWRESFGTKDESEEIYLSIIRKLPHHNDCNFIVQITSRHIKNNESGSKENAKMLSRSILVTPKNDRNLDWFLKSYQHFKTFYLVPAGINSEGEPVLLNKFSIAKKKLAVKMAVDIGESDIENLALEILH